MSASDKIDWETVLGFASESLDTQIKGTDEHKLSNKLYKTEEEIGRYLLDEKLDDIDRAVHLLRNGMAVQKHSVAGTLIRLLHERGPETKTRLLPVIASIIPNEQHDLQIMFGKAIAQSTEQGFLSGPPLNKLIPVARAMIAKKDAEVAEAWSEILLTMIQHLTAEIIEKEILPELLVDEGLAQPSTFRLWRARVIGVVAPRIMKTESQHQVFHKAMSLCQDTDYEVRACMCRQLNAIARAVGHERAVRELLPEYVELIMDEECVVREAAIDNIMQLMDFFEPAVKVQTIIPLWKKLCEEQSPRILQCLARQLGAFLWETREQLPDNDLRYFTNFYHSLSTSSYSEDETREMCAFNFPAIVKCALPQSSGFESHRLDIAFERMVADPNRNVRRRLAAGLHDVAALFGPRAWTYLRAGFFKLFADPDVEVYQQVYKHLGLTLLQFVKHESASQDTQLEDVLFLILRRERECATYTSRNNWRLHQTLLEQFRYFPDVFGLDLLHGHCVPLLFKTLHENVVLPIKTTIIRCVCTFLKFAKRTEHREKLYRHMYDLKDSPNCHTRLLFIDLCEQILTHYSNRFFRESFFSAFLELVKDPVANVRLRVVPLLPEIRRGLRKAQDSALQARVTDAIGVLIGDEDIDVSAAAKALPASKNDGCNDFIISNTMGMGKRGGGVSMDGFYGRSNDSIDFAKEEEEQKMLMMEWETEEAARRRDMDDARHEFAKQLAEKSIGKKGKVKAGPGVEGSSGGSSGGGAGSKIKTGPGLTTGSSRSKAQSALHSKTADLPTSSSGIFDRRGPASSSTKPGTTATRAGVSHTAGEKHSPAMSDSGSSNNNSHRIARSANPATQGGAGVRKPGGDEFDIGRLPGLRSAAAGTSPRSTRSARAVVSSSSGGAGGASNISQGTAASSSPSSTTSSSSSSTSKGGGAVSGIGLHSGLAPMRRSQELLNHGFGGAGGTSSTTSSGSAYGTISAARMIHGQPKTTLKLSPIPKAMGKDTGDSSSSSTAVPSGRRAAASAHDKDGSSKASDRSGFLVK
ncbi:armadillo-type protein [Powellomyces hirtus]|nr:armadillo-type protein [Powellomyces hirtus]